MMLIAFVFFFQAEDGIRAGHVTGVQTCALPIFRPEIATDGSIEMHGLFELTDAAPAETGARLNTNPDPTELELFPTRSEERRVGKECTSGWSAVAEEESTVEGVSVDSLIEKSDM